ncbi:MAG: hypothetical protein K9G33_09165 [Sneathiella sp.]|nr:hypothetical protein [Sneathiella sp.]
MREQQLLAENKHLREKNRRLSAATLMLVDRIESNLLFLENQTPIFESSDKTARESRAKKSAFKGRPPQREHKPHPKMEVYETYREPIEFAEPAPEMRFGPKNTSNSRPDKASQAREEKAKLNEFAISPDLEPEEIDLLKSPTRERSRQRPVRRETVEVVDLHAERKPVGDAPEVFVAGEASASEIPEFEFPEDEPVIDIEFERKETLRAAMRRRVNRLRW